MPSGIMKRLRTLVGFASTARGMSTVECAMLSAIVVGAIVLSLDLFGEASDPQAASTGRFRLGLMVCLLIAQGVAWYRLRRGDHLVDKRRGPAPSWDASFAPRRFMTKRQHIMKTLVGDPIRVLMNELLVRDLMTTDVTTAAPEMPIEELAVLMKQLDVRHLIVCDSDNEVIGIVSDRDLSQRGRKTADIMTPYPVNVSPDALMGPAMSQILQWQISSLPVVENRKLIGIVTTTDLVIAFQCIMEVVKAAAADMGPNAYSCELPTAEPSPA
jgi:CBS domain-containing protein